VSAPTASVNGGAGRVSLRRHVVAKASLAFGIRQRLTDGSETVLSTDTARVLTGAM
jgi:hypothetical protein